MSKHIDFNNQKIYRKHRPLKFVINFIIILLVVVLILTASIFFGFRRYIVYTDDGLYLDVPWLEEDVPTANLQDDTSSPVPQFNIEF